MDSIDLQIVSRLQERADIALAELSRRLGVSKTTCWNRLQRLEERGVVTGRYVGLDRHALGLPVVAFLSITVGRHSQDSIDSFMAVIDRFPEVVEAHRLTGEGADYQLKVVCPDIESYDAFQQRLIGEIDFNSMSTRIALKEVKSTHRLPLSHLGGQSR